MNRCVSLVFATLLAATGPISAQTPKPHDIEDFIREDKFESVSVSQKGTYVAMTRLEGDKTVMYILKTGETKPLTRVDVGGRKSHIGGVTWISDHRLIYSVAVKDQLDERPVPTGEAWAIDADGGKRRPFSGNIVDTLVNEDDYVLATIYSGGDGFTTLQRVNVYGGASKIVARAPIRYGWFSADANGQPRFAGGFDEQDKARLYFQKPGQDSWELINNEAVSGKLVFPVGFSIDGKTAYLKTQEKTGPDSILAFDIATATSKRISRDALANPANLINAIGKREIIGVLYAGSTPRYEYFDPDSAEAKAHRSLQKAFPGMIVDTAGYTTSNNDVLVYVYGDREPGGYYVMNRETRKVSPMMFSADWLDPNRLASMRNVTFTARDGRTIPALLTIPAGSDGKHLPMVVHPHGGPFDVEDAWGYDTTVQILASHGYAVLQVNFRGSGGFGREHEESGYKQWGLKMQDDLTDATRWAIAEGIAERDRICIFGASYGGYASLMGVAKEPDLYRCAVGQVGVYDLGKFKQDDAMRGDFFRRYHETATNDGDLDPVSPARLADRIKVPVFLTTGKEDARVPYQHTEMMEAALKKAGVPVETLYFKTEGHGIYKLEHKRQFYAQLLNFLHRHIGGRAPVVVATPPEKK
ncbi:MAG: alpha/beta hydrolase family protein [Pseudomonadota bacterium]